MKIKTFQYKNKLKKFFQFLLFPSKIVEKITFFLSPYFGLSFVGVCLFFDSFYDNIIIKLAYS